MKLPSYTIATSTMHHHRRRNWERAGGLQPPPPQYSRKGAEPSFVLQPSIVATQISKLLPGLQYYE